MSQFETPGSVVVIARMMYLRKQAQRIHLKCIVPTRVSLGNVVKEETSTLTVTAAQNYLTELPTRRTAEYKMSALEN